MKSTPSASEKRLALEIEDLLRQEEDRGGKMIVRFRFIIMGLLVLAAISGTNLWSERLVNLAFVGLYLLVNLAVLLVYKKGDHKLRHAFNFISILLDLAVMIAPNLYYWRSYEPDNFAFALKSPLAAFMILPMILTLMQFRKELILFASASVLIAYGGLIAFGLYSGMPTTSDWVEHNLGRSVSLAAILISFPIIVISLAFIARYSLVRSVAMLERIAGAETRAQMLSRYFSPEVVNEITANFGEIVRGRHQPVTILFSDIRDFTAMSEGLDPDALADLLTDIRRLQIEAVFGNNGTIDKFIGDAIMATFGTPRPAADPAQDALNAVRCGWQMLQKIKAFSQDRVKAGQVPIRIGIGIHAGAAFAGNIGAEEHLEYTVIGDAVNTASRIESLCKTLQSEFLISENCYNLVRDHVIAAAKPPVQVKGKEQPLRVFAVSGVH